MGRVELFEDLLAKNIIVNLFMLHRFLNLFSLPLFCRIIFFGNIQCHLN